MRDLYVVLDRMIALIPADQTDLIKAIRSVYDQIQFTAPEIMHDRWVDVQRILEQKIGTPTEEWHNTIGRIWANKEYGSVPRPT